MTDVLEYEGHFRQADLSTKQIVVIVLQLAIGEVIPPAMIPVSGLLRRKFDQGDLRARITIQQRRSLYELPAVLAPLTLERLVRLAERVLVEQEEFPERVQREVSLDVFLLVHHRGRERLLVRLPLEDLLLDRTGGDEPINEAFQARRQCQRFN